MKTRIHTLEPGVCNVFLLRSRGTIAVDGGSPGKGDAFRNRPDRAGIAPSDVRLLVPTHGHWDHVGSARAVQEGTGAPIPMQGAAPGRPLFADDLEQVKRSWKILLDRGGKTFYPAHGKPFDADLIQRRLNTRPDRA